jgi:hypothetical protein
MNFNLILGAVWLAAGVALVAWDAAAGGSAPHFRGPYGLSLGWLMLLLAGYNLLRGYALRKRRPKRDELHEALQARLQARRERAEPSGSPDPNFIFTDEPPPPPPEGPPSEQR